MYLSERQKEIVKLTCEIGGTSKQIGQVLHLESSTVSGYLSKIYQVLNVKNKASLIAFVNRNPNIIKSLRNKESFRCKVEPLTVKAKRLKAAFLIAELRDKCKDSGVKDELNTVLFILASPLR